MSNKNTLRLQAEQQLGQRIQDTWTLERLLGFGAAAAVYQAFDGERRVALKLMHRGYLESTRLRLRFQREAEISMALDHPNILKIFDTGEREDGAPYLLMELLDGATLKDVLRNVGGKLDPERTLKIARQLLSGLSAVHDYGVLHRDLKPSNIYLTRAFEVKLFDFGVARLDSSDQNLTMDGTVLGTPAFMSPEQARGRLDMLDARSDLFAVGATLYALLTGRVIHKAQTAEEALILAATRPPSSIARVAPDLPQDLIWLIDKSLAWNPAKRFESARAMLSHIERQLEVPAPNIPVATPAANVGMADVLLEDDTQDDALPPSALSAFTQVFSQIERCLDAARTYGPTHAETLHQRTLAYEALLSLMSKHPESISFSIKPYSLIVQDHTLWEPESPWDAVPYHLFASGLRMIHVRPGLSEQAFGRFLDILRLDPNIDLPPEDDLASVLWQENFEHIELQMVSTFRMDDPEEQENFLLECEEQRSRTSAKLAPLNTARLQRTRMLLSLDPSALAEAQGMDVTVRRADPEANLHLIQDAHLAALTHAARPEGAHWNLRLPLVLAHAYQHAQDSDQSSLLELPLQDLFARYVRTGEVNAALSLYGNLCACLHQRHERVFLTAMALPAQLIAPLITSYLARLGDPAMLDPRMLHHLKELLLNLDGRHVEVMATAYEQVQTQRALVVLFYAYLRRHAQGNEAAIAALAARTELGHTRKLVELLLDPMTPEGAEALSQLDGYPHDDLRIELLNARAKAHPDRITASIITLAGDPKPEVRVRALQAAERHSVPNLAEYLKQRTTQPNFHNLAYSERRLLLLLLLLHEPRYAYRAAVDILKAHGLTPDDTRSTTRMIAVEMLTHLPITHEAVEALTAASKRRWWNSRELQEAAAAALSRLQGKRR